MSVVKLNFKSIGIGQPILILHGLFGSLDNWQTIAKNLSKQGFQVFTVDLRNHGKSPHTDEMSHELMLEDVKAFIEDKDLLNPIVVGHSMGGKTAMQLALTYPEVVGKLVVVDIAPKSYHAQHNIYFDAMENLDLSKVTSRKDAREAMKKTVKSTAVRQFLLKNLDRVGENQYEWKFNLKTLRNSYMELIRRIDSTNKFEKPTLFINGNKSDYITAGDSMDIKELFPNSTIETIHNAGHWVHAEQPEEFLSVLINFAKE